MTSSLWSRSVAVSPFFRVILLGTKAKRFAAISTTRADPSARTGRELVMASIESNAKGKQIRNLDFIDTRLSTLSVSFKGWVLSEAVARR